MENHKRPWQRWTPQQEQDAENEYHGKVTPELREKCGGRSDNAIRTHVLRNRKAKAKASVSATT